jgi:hypothetical protein
MTYFSHALGRGIKYCSVGQSPWMREIMRMRGPFLPKEKYIKQYRNGRKIRFLQSSLVLVPKSSHIGGKLYGGDGGIPNTRGGPG